VVAAALGFVGIYLVIAVIRIGYPYELEWLEGGCVDHVLRVLDGRSLYAEPSLEFVSYIYSPLYFYVSAAAAWLFGIGFFPLRLVSLLASVGSFAVLFLLVRRETGSSFWGVLSAGLFAATFRVCGAWFDLARVDTLFLMFTLLGIYVLRSRRTVPGSLLAALLLAAAFMTKQTALLIAAPLGLYCLLARKGWDRIAFAGSLGTFVLASTWIFDRWTDLWYRFYVFDLPGRHAIVWSLTPVFLRDGLAPILLALLFSIYYLAAGFRREKLDATLFYGSAFAGLVGSGFLSRLHWGGYDNVFLTSSASIAILFGLGGHALHRRITGGSLTAPAGGRVLLATLALYAAILGQFAALVYDPRAQLPSAEDREVWDRLVGLLAEMEGDVFVPAHGYVAVQAGKRGHAQGLAYHDSMRWSDPALGAQMREEIRRTIAERRFAAIVIDSRWDVLRALGFGPVLDRHYRKLGEVQARPDVFWPRTGMPTRPDSIWVPRETEPAGP
jgi:hypothetical protein